MRAINTTTATRPAPTTWHLAVPLVLTVCAVALPATASASPTYESMDATVALSGPSDNGSGQPSYQSMDQIAGVPVASDSGSGDSGPSYQSMDAIAGLPALSEPTPVSSPPSSVDDGFEWLSAAIGAAAAMALLALGAAALLTVRRRTAVSAKAATS